jgi:hypothetical protein
MMRVEMNFTKTSLRAVAVSPGEQRLVEAC